MTWLTAPLAFPFMVEAALIAAGPKGAGQAIAPQLYTAPDPTEDPEADRAMLDRGIPVRGRSELLELLEDLGS